MIVAFVKNHILMNPLPFLRGSSSGFVSKRSLMTPVGMVLPLTEHSMNLVGLLRNKPLLVPNFDFYFVGIVLTPDGRFVYILGTRNCAGDLIMDDEVPNKTFELPSGPEDRWCHGPVVVGTGDPSEEIGSSVIELIDCVEDILPLLAKTSLVRSQNYQLVPKDDLVAEVRALMAEMYPISSEEK